MHSYYLEFVLNTYHASEELIKSSLTGFGEGLEISLLPQDTGKGENFKVSISTQDPTVIFDICAQLGRIKTMKVDEEGRA